MQRAQVVKLDRGYPLVRCEDGRLVRCEHATALVKGEKVRAVIGDFVEVNAPEGHDKGIIESICPRERAFVRKDPTERAVPQVLAANFDRVILAQPLVEVNLRRLERELVLAYETGAAVTVVLTKADLAESEEQVEQVADRVRTLAGPDVRTLVVSDGNTESVEAVRAAVESGEIAPERFASYQALKQETATLRDRREEARRMRGEKASDKKRGGQGGRPGRGKRRR